MYEVETIFDENIYIRILTDGEYYYLDDGSNCYKQFNTFESAEDWAMHM